MDRRDFFPFATYQRMTGRDINDLSVYGIFPVQVISMAEYADEKRMSPKTYFLHDILHWVRDGSRIADHSYNGFDLHTLHQREIFLARFKEMAVNTGDPIVEEALHQIYGGITHDVDPKFYRVARLQQHLSHASLPGMTFRRQVLDDIENTLGWRYRVDSSHLDAAFETMKRFLDDY